MGERVAPAIAAAVRDANKLSTDAGIKFAVRPLMAVRLEGANHQWRKNPPGELLIDPVADERLMRVTVRVGAS
jgi:hypothetical protein